MDEVARLVHSEEHSKAAKLVADSFGWKDPNSEAKEKACLQRFVSGLLNNGELSEAAKVLWTPALFDPRPQCTREVWKLFDDASLGLIMGAASMSKSYTMGVRLLLEWLRDPDWTTVRVIGPSKDHLEQNLFSHLVGLHAGASIDLPGDVGELWIGSNRRQQLGSIKGIVVPTGKNKKAGRLQGAKRKPRPQPHPVFGSLSRLFVFLDEIENVPNGIWFDIDNIISNAGEGFKIFGAYNPTAQADEVGVRACPPFGWENLDPDKHFRWKSTRGWEVLRLDGERSENVVLKTVIYPGLQTQEGLDQIAQNSGGRTSAGYFTMGRGLYPTQGSVLTIIPPGMFHKSRGEFIWYNEPKNVGSCDLALEGESYAVFTIGRVGLVAGVKRPPSFAHPNGVTEYFKDRQTGAVRPRYGLQADQQFRLEKGNTEKMAEQIISICRRGGIPGYLLALDRTGHGAGVADLVKNNWSSDILDINYSEGCTESKIFLEDSKTCKDAFYRIDTELWFALRAWMEFGYFIIHPQIEIKDLLTQITERRYKVVGGKNRIEAKKDYKERGHPSPDEADSLGLFVHAARAGEHLTLSMAGNSARQERQPEPDPWPDEIHDFRLDAASEFEHLPDEDIL